MLYLNVTDDGITGVSVKLGWKLIYIVFLNYLFTIFKIKYIINI